MVHTLPDWTTKYKLVNIFSNIDDAELAVRLGSVNRFDRRGWSWFYETFEDTLARWQLSGLGVGCAAALSTVSARSGKQSALLTTGNAVDDWELIYTMLPYPPTTRFGYEISFTLGTSIKSLELQLSFYTGTQWLISGIKVDVVGNTLQYVKPGPAYQTFKTVVPFYQNDYSFHTLKFVVDLSTLNYVRCLYDDMVMDMSSYLFGGIPDGTARHMESQITVKNNAAGNHHCYLDDLIFTIEEP